MGLGLGSVLVLAGAIALVREDSAAFADGLLAIAVVALASLAGLAVLGHARARPAGAWAGVLLIAQGARMIAALLLGLAAFFAADPDPMVFWMLFLTCALVVLAGEVSFIVRWMRSECERIAGEAA